MNRWRYSRAKFHGAVAIAAAMTAMVCGTAWMLMAAFHVRHADLWAAALAVVFFGFVSAAMVWRALRNETVLAVLPSGLYDARWRVEPVAWEAIREIVLRRRESEHELDVYLWKPQAASSRPGQPARPPDHTVDLAPLDAAPDEIVAAIARHMPVRADNGGHDAGPGIELVRKRG